MAFEDVQNQRARATAQVAVADSAYDAGLRQHMLGIYNYMFAGLGVSGAVAYFLTATGASTIFFTAPGQFTALGWVALFAPLALLLLASFSAARLSTAATHAIYWSVAANQSRRFSSSRPRPLARSVCLATQPNALCPV
jgi:FtsH-binding integral membrane protein